MVAIFPASTKAGGQCLAVPDVCLTPAPPAPPVPIPYPNIGMVNQASKTSTKVKFAGKAVVTKKSEIPRSSGDEAGVNKGVVSGMNMDKVTFKKGSSKVKIQGQPCVHLTTMTGHNGSNANNPAGAQIAPSQTKVIIAP
ncbi:MAG: DUF4150 domain-containing protein [Pseudomonadales bacterium]|nr:DUF4150 domain-containing protein [Pseudomonadales bacterium]